MNAPLRQDADPLALLGRLVRTERSRRSKRLGPADDAKRLSFFDWARTGGFIADREPVDFSVWRYLEKLYRVVPPNPKGLDVTIKKPAQAGASVWAMLLVLNLALRSRLQLAYYLPSAEYAFEYSQNRFIRLVRENKGIHGLMGDPDTPHLRRVVDEGSASVRRLLWSIIYYTYVGGDITTEGKPLDGLMFDEVQAMVPKDIQKTQERIAASQLKLIARLSTPNFEDGDIDYFYKRSDQREFHTRCACAEGVSLTEWFDPEEGPLCIDRGSGANKSVPTEPFYFCPRCKTNLGPGGGPDREDGLDGMRVQEGDFLAHNPGALGVYGGPAIGLHWGQMLSPRISARDILAKWDTRSDTKDYFNRVVGRCYTDPKTQPVTEAHCVAAQREYLRWGPRPQKDVDGTFLGIDQMGHDNRAVIASKVGGRMQYLWMEVILGGNPWKRCAQLMREYRITQCAVEALPNFNEAHRFSKEFPGRVFLVNYTDLTEELVVWSDRIKDADNVVRTDDEARTPWWCRVDQFRMMSWALARWSHGEVEMPDVRTLRQEVVTEKGRETVEIGRMFWKHQQRVALVTDQAKGRERERKLRRRVEKIGIDPHFAYANMLMCVAWVRQFGWDRIFTGTEDAMEKPARSGSEEEQLREALRDTVQVPKTALTCADCTQLNGRKCELRGFSVSPTMQACEHVVPQADEEPYP